LPFAELLNTIENDLEKLHVYPVVWQPPPGSWEAMSSAPDYTDINRWETNGKAITDYAMVTEDGFRYSGIVYAGDFFMTT
jgi:hypothetical protein